MNCIYEFIVRPLECAAGGNGWILYAALALSEVGCALDCMTVYSGASLIRPRVV